MAGMQTDMYTGSNAQVAVTTWNDKRNKLDTPVTYESLQGDWHKIQLGYQYSSKSYECWIDDSHKHSGIADDLSGFETTDTVMIRVQKIQDYDNQGYWYLDDISVAVDDRPTEIDTISPIRSNPQPTGELTSGTTSTTISLTTNETATCKYGTLASVPYDDIPNTFSSTNSTTHSQNITGLSDGNTYTYYIRCQDTETPPNQNTDDFTISFNIANPCTESWTCTEWSDWSSCIDSQQSRTKTCVDENSCGTETTKPDETETQACNSTYGISHFTQLLIDWLQSIVDPFSVVDLNEDGIVNTRDLGIMMSNWEE